MQPRPDARPISKVDWALGVGLALLVGAVYFQVRTHSFVDYDVDLYLTQNAMVRQGLSREGLAWAFGYHAANWHPLTWLSHMLDVELYGLAPAGHHLTNAAFHVANTLLVFVLLLRWTGALGRSLLVAALFGLHPMHVESVAWAVERKDVLSACFGLGFLLAWTSWLRAPSWWRYALACVLFCLGLMAKSMILTLPLVLMLADVWPLQRGAVPLQKRVLEKLPLLVPMLASAVLTSQAQLSGGALSSFSHIALAARVANAVWAWPQYLLKLVWPTKLMAFYPWLDRSGDEGALLVSGIVMVGLTALVLYARRAAPYLAVGWLWFVGMLVPVIGLIQVGDQAMADRYTYLPSIGLFVAIVWGVGELAQRFSVPLAARWAAGAALTVLMTVLCWKQVATWQSTRTLAEHGLAVDPDNFKMHGLLGYTLSEEARFSADPARAKELNAAAEREFRECVRISPNDPFNLDRLGYLILRQGRIQEAIPLFEHALEHDPGDKQVLSQIRNHLGGAYDGMNKVAEAESWMRKALEADPNNLDATRNLGWILERQRKFAEAEVQYRRALELRPNDGRAEWRMGAVCRRTGRFTEAMQWLELALQHGLTPGDAQQAREELELARKGPRQPAGKNG